MEAGAASDTFSQRRAWLGRQWYIAFGASVNERGRETRHERDQGQQQRIRMYASPGHRPLQPRCSPAEDGPCIVVVLSVLFLFFRDQRPGRPLPLAGLQQQVRGI